MANKRKTRYGGIGGLTRRQMVYMRHVADILDRNGVPATAAEVSKELGVVRSATQSAFRRLTERGMLSGSRKKHSHRTYALTDKAKFIFGVK